jgi:ParB family transcriptional regulator, chromosome partitioning protein
LSVWPVDLMAQAGCVVFVGQEGSAQTKCGLLRPKERNDMAKAVRQAPPSRCPGGVGVSWVTLPAPNTRPLHSEKLMRRLTAHRVAAVQAELIDRPDVALVALTAPLAVKLMQDGFRRYFEGADALTISATDTHETLRRETEDMADSAAWKKLDAERSSWVARMPDDGPGVFAWLLDQDQQTVLRLLTFLVASSVTGVSGTEGDRQVTDPLAQAALLHRNAHAGDAPEPAPMRCAAKAVGQGCIQYRNSASSRSGSTGLVR